MAQQMRRDLKVVLILKIVLIVEILDQHSHCVLCYLHLLFCLSFYLVFRNALEA
jgi:hypothetical protein